jgi:hypothetical protein
MFNFRKVKDGLRNLGVGMLLAGFLGLVLDDNAAMANAAFAVLLGLVFFALGVLDDNDNQDD